MGDIPHYSLISHNFPSSLRVILSKMCREACDSRHARTRMPAKEAYYREVTSVTLYGSIFIANNDDGEGSV